VHDVLPIWVGCGVRRGRHQFVATHAHEPMNSPRFDRYPGLRECLRPRQDVVIAGIDQRAVEINNRRVQVRHRNFLSSVRGIEASSIRQYP
jgi:hypothetical protein